MLIPLFAMSDTHRNATGMEDLSKKLLSVLDTNGTFSSNEVAASLNVDHQTVVGVVNSLERREGVIISL